MRGFTLLETLVALAVFGLLLTGLTYTERAYHRALATEGEALRMQQKQAVVELLRTEVAMAGYRHVGPGISVSSERHTDRLAFTYLEDRLGGGPELRTVTFDAGRDRNGLASLYQQQGSGNRQPAVLGLRELRVVGWADASGVRTVVPTGEVAAVLLELVFDWDERTQIAIGFLNPVSYGVQGDV